MAFLAFWREPLEFVLSFFYNERVRIKRISVRARVHLHGAGIRKDQNFHDDLSIAYLVPSDDAAAEALDAAFGETAVFDGTSYVLTPSITRKTVMVPASTDALKAHPAE